MITPEVIREGLRLDAEYQEAMRKKLSDICDCELPRLTKHALSHYADALRAASRVQELENLLRDMIDPETCHYDHNDLCQEHYCDRPCKHEQAKAALGIEVDPR